MKAGLGGLKREFKEVWKYIRESRNYIYTVIIIFAVGAILGFFFFTNFTFLEPIIRELAKRAEGLNTLQMIGFILSNNVQSAFMSLLLGVFVGLFPIASSLVNGVTLGYVLHKVWLVDGITQFWRIFPHGIFELPAVFISMGLGLRMGLFIFSKNRWRELKYRAYNSFAAFFLVVLPLLVIAAIIEGILIVLSR